MANTTEAYWDINGVSLQTYEWNVTTWGGDLQSPPPLRGSDITIPYRPGQVMQARRPDGRSITFNMWVQGTMSDGKYAGNFGTNNTQRVFQHNWRQIRNLFYNNGEPVTLTKRWTTPDGATTRSASAQAIYANGLDLQMTGAGRAAFSVEMYLPDPFFYGPQETITTPSSPVSNISRAILGDYETTDMTIDFQGFRNVPRLTNVTEGVYVELGQYVPLGSSSRLDVNNWTARRDPTGANTNVIGAVTHFGHEFWMVLRPGVQQFSLTGVAGNGQAIIKYRPRYF